jgi:hypothetical protein
MKMIEILHFDLLRHTKSGDQLSMEKICMDTDELSSFLADKSKLTQNFINEFEMDSELREKGLLSLDGMLIFLNTIKYKQNFYQGFRNMLLSEHFNIINSPPIYQDMTRYKKQRSGLYLIEFLLDHYAIITSIHLITRRNRNKPKFLYQIFLFQLFILQSNIR